MEAIGGFRIWLFEGKIAEKAAYLFPEVMLHCPYSALLAEYYTGGRVHPQHFLSFEWRLRPKYKLVQSSTS
jgi:hypothetical protein